MPVSFEEALGAHRRANVEAEIAAMLGSFSEAMLSAFDADDPAAAMSENLGQFEARFGAAVPKWAAGEGVLKRRVPAEPIRKLHDAVARVLRDAGEEDEPNTTRKETPMEATKLLKTRDAVMTAATEIAKAELAADPSLGSLPAARARVWRERRDLAARYRELPIEEPAAPEPMSKVGPAMREATREAVELRKRHPGRYKSVAAARAEIYRADPELRDRVSREASEAGGRVS